MHQKRILIVEDNPLQQRLYSAIIENIGVNALIVADGAAALKTLDLHPEIALVVMDWHMNNMDGIECTKRIRMREAGSGKHIPILAVTGSGMQGDRQNCLASGMDDYLSKPFSLQQFGALISKWLQTSIDKPIGTVRIEMTLPELLEIAAQSSKGQIQITTGDRKLLIHLLEVYADEVLEPGQRVDFEGARLSKSSIGAVLVQLIGANVAPLSLLENVSDRSS
jgi:CheY-like chemotaxis protein